ncbi:MAG TPA: hypothetical protein VFN22_07720 [Gemmatimonadales bacterium]|nr:hypothetical protein [Gemmatimonadales bacterium]
MSSFRFRLQRLLELRSAAERARAADMGRVAAEEARLRAVSDAEAARLSEVEAQQNDNGPVPAGLRAAWGLSADAARARLHEADDAVRDASDRREVEEARFSDARMARRSLERLRDRQKTEWTAEHGRQEQADSDEVARQVNAKGDQS